MLGTEKIIVPDMNDINYASTKQSEKSLMAELQKLDKAYQAIKDGRLNEYIASLPSSYNLEKKSYDAPSDDALKEEVITNLSGDYETGKNKLIEQIESNKLAINKSKNNLSKSELETLDKLDNSYKAVKENINNQAIKRGIGRSSIVFNKLSDADLSKAVQKGIIENDTRLAIEELDSEIEALEKQKQDSLKAFDLTYAAKIDKELQEKIADRDKKAADVLEYNNKIAIEEAEFQADKADKIEDYKDKLKKDDISDEEYYEKNGYMPTMKGEYEERYSMAYDFYMKLPADTAKRILNENSELEKYLGTKYYNQLRTIVVMRK